MTGSLTAQESKTKLPDGLPSLSNSLRSALSSYDYTTQDLSFTSAEWKLPGYAQRSVAAEAGSFVRALVPVMGVAPSSLVREWLSALGILVAGQLSVVDARVKMAALADMLREYPVGVFTRANLAEVAKKSKWLPSFAELAEVLDRKTAELQTMHARAMQVTRLKEPEPIPTHYKQIPKSQWDRFQWQEYVTDAEKMVALAEQNPSMMNADEWRAILEQRRQEGVAALAAAGEGR